MRLRRVVLTVIGMASLGVGGASSVNVFAQAPARRLLTGTVRDSTGAPVVFATLEVLNGPKVATDDSGRFALRLGGRGPISVEVRRIGFQAYAFRLPAGSDTSLSIVLARIPQRLSAVAVKGEATLRTLHLRGFYRRLQDRERGILNGDFITPEEIERRSPPRITMMLDGVQGVRVVKRGDAALNWAVLGPSGCLMDGLLGWNPLELTKQRLEHHDQHGR